jgi:hypothetical protein
MEPIPLLFQKLDKKCCCNNSKYFIDSKNMSSLDKANKTYKNEIDFLENFIYEKDEQIFMTIFDDEMRRRCNRCDCCKANKHKIKITQLYHLLKYCIIYETNVDISNTSDEITKNNILDIFKKDTKLNCYDTHETNDVDEIDVKENVLEGYNFKTLYEYIIENLISNDFSEPKKMEQHINHYKYVANIRDYIINNFETNVFPIFNKKRCPDLMVSNFNPNLFFFDFEINKIITIINENKQNDSYLIKYINDNYIIRNDIGFNYLKCLIHSYKDILKSWIDVYEKINDISNKEWVSKWSSKAKDILQGARGLFRLYDNNQGVRQFPQEGNTWSDIVNTIVSVIDSASAYLSVPEEEKKLSKDLNILINEKQFIYKNAEWDKQNNKLKKRNSNFSALYLDLESSKTQIISKLSESDLKKFKLNNECNYLYYLLLSITFLEEDKLPLHLMLSHLKPSHIIPSQIPHSSHLPSAFLPPIPRLSHDLLENMPPLPPMNYLLQNYIAPTPDNHDHIDDILKKNSEIFRISEHNKGNIDIGGGNNELFVNRRKNVSHKKLLNKTNKIISKKKNNNRNRINPYIVTHNIRY